jgi:hypothetical protein
MVFVPHGPFNYRPFYIWRAPRLSAEERGQWGERISSLGEDHFLRQFRKTVGTNPLMSQDPAHRAINFEAGPCPPRMDNFVNVARAVIHPTEYVILGSFLLVCLALSWFTEDLNSFKFFAIVLFGIMAVWWASLFFGFYRYRKWLRALMAEYRDVPATTGKQR